MEEEIKKIEWDDSYLLDVPEIDMQHKKLISIANQFYDVINGDETDYKIKMSGIIKKLTDYTEYHFTNEEELQQKIGYTGYPAHKQAHDYFIKEVGFQIQKLSDNDKSSLLGFYKYMVNWILTHVAKADKVWANFLKQK